MENTISHYRILEKIGEGGMGVVYRAEDTLLGRQVAIKLLPAKFSAREDLRVRMLREARTAASLNHPNICTIHEVGELESATKLPDVLQEMLSWAPATPYIVMELFRGQTLHAMLVRTGPLPVKDLLDIALQVAEGLAEAHAHHIVHRDLKPQNVMVGDNGRVKILDFGLAKPLQTPQPPDQVTTLAAIEAAEMSREGNVIGTVAYMSPEQALGMSVDSRSDVFAFGTMLYEIATNQRPFQGQTVTGTLAKILEAEPAQLSGLRPGLPAGLERIIRRCLQKQRDDRYNDTRDLLADLKELRQLTLGMVAKPAPEPVTAGPSRWFWAGIIAAAVGSLVMAFFLLHSTSGNHTAPQTSSRQITFLGNAVFPTVSPDGQFLAYATMSPDEAKVIVHDLASGRTLEVLQGKWVKDVRWSPDGANILVTGEGTLKIVSRLGGPPRVLPGAYKASWSPDGSQLAWAWHAEKDIQLYFTDMRTGAVRAVPLQGRIAFLEHVDWSPTGEWILFVSIDTTQNDRASLWIIKPDGSGQQKLLEEESSEFSARWGPMGNAIYYIKGAPTRELWKLGISPKSGTPEGAPVQVLTSLESGPDFTISRDGKHFAYPRRTGYSNLWLATVEATIQAKELTTGTLTQTDPSFSPDGTRIAYSRGDGKTSNIFVLPTDGGSPQQITFMKSQNQTPVWSPDGRSIAFGSNEGGAAKVWQVPASGGTPHPFPNTTLSNTFVLRWAPGPNILYHRPGNRNFYILDPTSGAESPLMNDEMRGWIFNPVYSPNAREVVTYWNRFPAQGLYVIPFDGAVPNHQQTRRVTGSPSDKRIEQTMDAAEYRGKEVKLTAHVKANVTGEANGGACWLVVAKANGQTDPDLRDWPIRLASWNVYEITSKVDADAKSLAFGCLLKGVGQVWVDDIRLSFKNEANGWTPIQIKNSGFEEGDNVTGWSTVGLGSNFRVVTGESYEGRRSLLISAVRLPEGRFTAIGWSADGKQIYAIDDAGNISALPAEGGDPKMMMTLPVPQGRSIGHATITQDGRRVVFTVTESQSDIWIVDNFDSSVR